MTKYIGNFLGFKLFAEQDMPKKSIEHMEKKLNSPMELFDIPVGYQYSPFRSPWQGLTDKQKLVLIKHSPDWTVLQLLEEVETMIRLNNE